jgi:hypothetical protein
MASLARVFIFFVVLFSSAAAHATCVTGNSLGYREFSLPRNSVCLIKRQETIMKLISIRVTVQPKLGRFGAASVLEFAYRAGNVAGDDYFEYMSLQSFNGGKPKEYRSRNVVHITP